MKEQLILRATGRLGLVAICWLVVSAACFAGVVPPSQRAELIRNQEPPRPAAPVAPVAPEERSDKPAVKENSSAVPSLKNRAEKSRPPKAERKKARRAVGPASAIAAHPAPAPFSLEKPAQLSLKLKVMRKLFTFRAAANKMLDALGIRAPSSRGAATAGFVFGLAGLVFALTFILAPIGVIFCIVGLILSLFGMEETIGVVGLVLSIIGILLGLFFTGLLFLVAASA